MTIEEIQEAALNAAPADGGNFCDGFEACAEWMQKQTGWISVRDGLPDSLGNGYSDRVLVCLEDGSVFTDTYWHSPLNEWTNVEKNDVVTHWQKIPSPPLK